MRTCRREVRRALVRQAAPPSSTRHPLNVSACIAMTLASIIEREAVLPRRKADRGRYLNACASACVWADHGAIRSGRLEERVPIADLPRLPTTPFITVARVPSAASASTSCAPPLRRLTDVVFRRGQHGRPCFSSTLRITSGQGLLNAVCAFLKAAPSSSAHPRPETVAQFKVFERPSCCRDIEPTGKEAYRLT